MRQVGAYSAESVLPLRALAGLSKSLHRGQAALAGQCTNLPPNHCDEARRSKGVSDIVGHLIRLRRKCRIVADPSNMPGGSPDLEADAIAEEP